MTLEEIGKTALSKDAPDPKQVQYESPEFEKLTQEIAKLSSLHGETVEWRDVIETSTIIIRDKSKDLEVVTYLCRGLWERDGYAGLRVGFTILRDIIQEYWDIAYPPKKKARMRGGKISWLADRVGKLLPDHEPKDEEKDTISACLELIKEIETILNEKLGDNAPVLRELREPFETYQKNFSFIAKKEEAPSPPTPPALDIPATQSVASANDIKKAFKSCHSTVYQVAKLKRAEKLSDPLPYRILRVSAWMSIEKMPFLQNGKFVVPAPPQNQILQLLEQQEYATLIEAVENMFANPDVQPANAYWLDAHRFTVTALEALGSQYDNAKQAVIEELAAFLRRFPKLPELCFNDDTPFADAQTKVWITEQVLITNSPEPEPVSGGGGEKELKTLKEAKQLASQGKFAEGLLVLQNAIQSAKNQREKFVGLLEQARFCYDMDHVELAKPMLEFLEQQVARFNLEEWEPTLSVEVARLLLMCKDTNRQLYARLCRLDVASALTLEKNVTKI
ncbi:type VI secretion system protein TssA [Candidatus Marithrix sp. Canyon 246]|uniref:type VI secretion system protein TssA n=1 Tax=Candidatus Marithrix sp. Canyon 246 TaxID=1827136 RepID=UPI00084A1628|nr:type VI secretion system protein TssA [Candidatus Marithrix sp. Canyon 246]